VAENQASLDSSTDSGEGCLVISPLVALMKIKANQSAVAIKAIALNWRYRSEEMIDLLDNCQFGNYKFLCISERLQSDWIFRPHQKSSY
jgi:ATP-dependent DNA helicase RecQ